jgi:hypothetical protein
VRGSLLHRGRDIDGKYLDVNEAELKSMFQKWRNEWHEYGVTIMCDSWTGLTHMSVIIFLLYSNGRMWFHSSIDATEKRHDAKFLLKVTTQFDSSLFLLHSSGDP